MPHEHPQNELAAAMRWHEVMNAGGVKGSRLVCEWDRLLTRHAAPGRYRSGLLFQPTEAFGTAIVSMHAGQLQTHATVMHNTTPMSVRVTLSKAPPLSYLVLDAVHVEDLRRWLQVELMSTGQQTIYRTALALLESEAALRMTVAKAMQADAPQPYSLEAIADALRRWQERQRREPLPAIGSDAFHALARQIFLRLKRQIAPDAVQAAVALVERMGHSLGHQPLRLQSTAADRVEVWMTMQDSAQDDQLAPWVWCERWPLKATQDAGWQVNSGRSFVHEVLPASPAAGVTILHEWEAAASWRDRHVPGGLNPEQRELLMALVDDSAAALRDGDLWGDPSALFERASAIAERPAAQLDMRLLGTVYRPSLDHLYAIVAMLPLPWLHAYAQSRGTPLHATIAAWAKQQQLDVQRAAPKAEIGLVLASQALRIFKGNPVHALVSGRPSPTVPRLLGIEHRLGLDEPGAITYLPTHFRHWLEGFKP
ncbi:MAG: hypothetical protein ACREPQ_00815 [Rhodanobacter sp.]